MTKTVKNNEAKIAAAIAEAEAKIATTVASLPNSVAIANVGKDALIRWHDGSTLTKAGDACGIYAFIAAQFTMTFDVVVARKGADVAEQSSFDIADLREGFKNTDGTNDRLKLSAAYEAVAFKLFGMTAEDYKDKDKSGAAKQAIFQRCLPTALDILAKLSHVRTWEAMSALVKLDKVVAGKDKDGKDVIVEMLSLPTFLAVDEPTADASENEKTRYEATKNLPLQLDGKQGNSITSLHQRCKPKRAATPPAPKADAGKVLVDSIKQVATTVATWNNADATTDIAPNTEMRQQLFALAQTLADYFKAYPEEADEELANVA